MITLIKNNRTKVFLVLIMLGLSACGFHLRGTDALPEEYSAVYVDVDRITEFVDALEQNLVQRGVSLVDSKGQSDTQILIHEDQSGQRILSVTATEGPEEYEVFHKIRYSVVIGDELRIDQKEVTLTRDYTYDKNNVLGKGHEYDSLRKALADEMAQTLVRRLRYVL